MELGILKTVAPRQKWINEARDFTPWLSNNIEELGSALGLELEVENIEVAVGPYSADILAKDTGTGQYVVIENQLEKTNHDHLGKSITYASVLDASTIIWVATDFTPEHKKAVDWLNDHTSDNISIYGVQLELWQIDNSRAAVKFNVVCKPNDAVMRVARAIATDELTESKRFQFEFWTKFRDKLALTRAIPSLQTPRPQYWFDVTLGKSNIHLSNTCNTDQNTVGIRVYIGSRIVDTMLPYLESRKAEIETELGEVLTWNPNPDNRDKVITLTKTTDFRNEKQVDEALDWLVQKTIHFRTVFAKIIRQQRSE
ncbi:MAG: DUF4268 domain-containing protein [Flavobacteriaceae bacterium]|jgi:hypothetical protein|nr:DUF4268 domain-containing protein [Flavobacteriaceae bacterium]